MDELNKEDTEKDTQNVNECLRDNLKVDDSSKMTISNSENSNDEKNSAVETCINAALGNESDDEFTESKEFFEDPLEDIDFDDDALQELFGNLSEEKLKECKEKVNELKISGNNEFKSKEFADAEKIYTQALNSCPLQFAQERSILYSNRAAARVSLDKKELALSDCNKAIELNSNYLRAILRRAQLYRKMEKLDESLADYKRVMELDRTNAEAIQACMSLPGEINERNEKLKTEMLGKLKELGNLVLRPFGLSTDNFNVVQDPNSGGYSINFQNNHQNS